MHPPPSVRPPLRCRAQLHTVRTTPCSSQPCRPRWRCTRRWLPPPSSRTQHPCTTARGAARPNTQSRSLEEAAMMRNALHDDSRCDHLCACVCVCVCVYVCVLCVSACVREWMVFCVYECMCICMYVPTWSPVWVYVSLFVLELFNLRVFIKE